MSFAVVDLRRVGLALALSATALFSGCASIINGTQQSVSVVAKLSGGEPVIGAKCRLSNTKGEWFTDTPGSVTVHRSYGALTVDCDHPQSTGTLEAKSTTKAMAFGNIIFGGAIGATIDIANGSAYDYPQLLVVPMTSKDGSPATAPIAEDSSNVERMPQSLACHPQPRATLSSMGPGFAIYAVQCSHGDRGEATMQSPKSSKAP